MNCEALERRPFFPTLSTEMVHPRHTPDESLGLPFYYLWPHPAEFSPARDQSAMQSFEVHLLGRLLSRNQMDRCWVVWLHLQAQPMLFSQQKTHLTCLSSSQGQHPAKLNPREGSQGYSEMEPLVHSAHSPLEALPRRVRSTCPPCIGLPATYPTVDCLDLPSQVPGAPPYRA